MQQSNERVQRVPVEGQPTEPNELPTITDLECEQPIL